ncbi:hypothetical protein GF325_08010 [Candidatus Bathyarchaeota archaeon]|nr:hypothetical protein [Candidatus Bathyarchaeota archaeon]
MRNVLLLVISYTYGLSVIGTGRILQVKLGKDVGFTRKIIHLFAGYSAFVVFWFNPDWAWLAIIIGCSFTFLLYLARSRGPLTPVFETMARDEERSRGSLAGPLYYATSLTILTTTCAFPATVPFYWIPASCLSMMFIGDGIAPIVGKRFGHHPYGTRGRTVEGSIGVLFGSYAGYCITILLAVFTSNTQILFIPQPVVFLLGVPLSIENAIIEGLTPSGYDNVTCPFITSGTMFFLVVLLS